MCFENEYFVRCPLMVPILLPRGKTCMLKVDFK